MSLRIQYDSRLIERTVDHAVRADPGLEVALHRETDPLFEIPHSRGRDAAFREVFGAFFERLCLDATLRRLLAERPLIGESVAACIVGPAPRASGESAELLVRNGEGPVTREDRTLMLQVLPQTLADPESAARRLRPELYHIADMVDSAFRYRRSQIEGLAARRNLIRDRYRVLWDIYVSGRLEREGFGAGFSRSRLRAQLARVFGIESDEAAELALARVFDAETLTHDRLLFWANAPDEFRGFERGRAISRSATAGASCPLCGFSTFDWFAFDGARTELVRKIESRHPSWAPGDGACRQCAEIYAAA